MLKWKIREMRETDHALVADSFLRSLTAELPAGACWKCLRRELEKHLRSPESIRLVAVSEDNDDQIFGWAIFTEPDNWDTQKRIAGIFYVYVRESFRMKGIASDLVGVDKEWLPAVGYPYVTAKGDAFIRAIERKKPGVHFAFTP